MIPSRLPFVYSLLLSLGIVNCGAFSLLAQVPWLFGAGVILVAGPAPSKVPPTYLYAVSSGAGMAVKITPAPRKLLLQYLLNYRQGFGCFVKAGEFCR